MEIKKYEKKEFTDIIQQSLIEQHVILPYCIYDQYYVLIGNSEQPNFDEIKKYKLDTIDIPIMGGTIIVGPGDIHFGIITHTNTSTNSFIDQGRKNLLMLLKNKGLDAKIDNNDILVSGFKVGSSFSRMVNNMCIGGFHISLNINLELIQNICNKPMIKIPKGLSEFGVTVQELETEVVIKTASEFNIENL